MDCSPTNWNFQPSPPYWTTKHNLDFKHLLVVLLSTRLGKQGRKKHTNCKAARKAWDSKFRSADSGRSSLHLSALCTLHRHSIHSVHYQQHKKQMLPHLLHILTILCYKSEIMYCTERDLFSWSTPIRRDGGGAHVNSKLWEHDQMNDIPDKRDHVHFCPSVNLSDELLCWEGSLTSSPLLFHLSCCCTPLSTSCSSIQHWQQLSPPCTPEKFCKSGFSISSSKPKKTQESARRTENTISFASVISQAQNLWVCDNDHVYKVQATKQLTDKAKTVETIN